VYNIGKFEVTAGQYTEFLNAVADEDTYGLYNPSMNSDSYGCQITQNGTSGSYWYDFSGGTVERMFPPGEMCKLLFGKMLALFFALM
jgi:hypothetical protein